MEFEEATPLGKERASNGYLDKGQLKVTTYGIYFGDKVYGSLGRPPKVGASVDRHNQLIRLDPRDEESHNSGWSPASYKMKSGRTIYRLRATTSPLLKQMPLGIYYPIGGGVFAFNTQNNHA